MKGSCTSALSRLFDDRSQLNGGRFAFTRSQLHTPGVTLVRAVRHSDNSERTIVTAIVTYARYRPAKRAGVAVAQCLVVPWTTEASR